jgi:hypothetical protein
MAPRPGRMTRDGPVNEEQSTRCLRPCAASCPSFYNLEYAELAVATNMIKVGLLAILLGGLHGTSDAAYGTCTCYKTAVTIFNVTLNTNTCVAALTTSFRA